MEEKQKICGFPIYGVIGKGSFGNIYSIKEGALKITKIISIPELSILSSIRYKYLLHSTKILDYNECNGQGIGMVLPLAISDTSRLKESSLLRDNIIVYLYQLSLGVRELHRNNILHLDIKPANVLLYTQFKGAKYVKLGDFSFSLFVEDIYVPTTQKKSFGTATYMKSLEMNSVDYSNDIYSLAITFIELLYGKSLLNLIKPLITNEADKLAISPPKNRTEQEITNYKKRVIQIFQRYLSTLIENIRLDSSNPSLSSNLFSSISLSNFVSFSDSISFLLSSMTREKPITIEEVVSFFEVNYSLFDNEKGRIVPHNIVYDGDNEIKKILNFEGIRAEPLSRPQSFIKKNEIDLMYRLYYSGYKNLNTEYEKIAIYTFSLSNINEIEVSKELSIFLKKLNWTLWRPYDRKEITNKIILSPQEYIEKTNLSESSEIFFREDEVKEESSITPSVIYSASSFQ